MFKDTVKEILYLVYVAMALTPFIIIFILQNQNIYQDMCVNIIIALCIIVIALFFSWFYIYCMKKYYSNTESEKMECSEIEIVEPRYIPIYISYFVIAVSIDNWIIFIAVFILIYLLILKCKFSYFNPYLLFFGYNFYKVSVDINQKEQKKYAKFKLFLISKQEFRTTKIHNNLIRLKDFIFLDKGGQND